VGGSKWGAIARRRLEKEEPEKGGATEKRVIIDLTARRQVAMEKYWRVAVNVNLERRRGYPPLGCKKWKKVHRPGKKGGKRKTNLAIRPDEGKKNQEKPCKNVGERTTERRVNSGKKGHRRASKEGGTQRPSTGKTANLPNQVCNQGGRQGKERGRAPKYHQKTRLQSPTKKPAAAEGKGHDPKQRQHRFICLEKNADGEIHKHGNQEKNKS